MGLSDIMRIRKRIKRTSKKVIEDQAKKISYLIDTNRVKARKIADLVDTVKVLKSDLSKTRTKIARVFGVLRLTVSDRLYNYILKEFGCKNDYVDDNEPYILVDYRGEI